MKIDLRENSAKSPPGLAGKIGMSLFLSIFGLMGTLFLCFMLFALWQELRVWFWQTQECIIEHSELLAPEDGESDYRCLITYSFSLENGRKYEGEKVSASYSGDSDVGKAHALLAEYPPGSRHLCYVNPADPAESCLRRDLQWQLIPFMLIPLIFMGLGWGGVWFVWFGKKTGSGAISESATSSISGMGGKSKSVGMTIFFSVFLLAGVGFMIPFFILPLWRIQQAREWPSVPCEVISSRVRTHSGSESTTYSVDILYRYQFRGRQWESNRYDFLGGSSSGYHGKKEIVDQHPPGYETVCYVNPDNPSYAVLQRGYSLTMLFGLIPLVFIIVGIFGIIHSLKRRRRKALDESGANIADNSFDPRDPDFDSGRYRGGSRNKVGAASSASDLELKPAQSPWGKFFVMLGLCIFWNGIVSVFVWQLVGSFQRGRPEWFLAVFLIPFVLIGFFIIAMVFHSLLALFNPRCRLHLIGQPRLGETIRLAWELSGKTSRLQSFSTRLEGREIARYQSGKNSRSDESIFANIDVFHTEEAGLARMGDTELIIPPGTMHSFKGGNNKIEWRFVVHGEIFRWPDLNDNYEVFVAPYNPGKINK